MSDDETKFVNFRHSSTAFGRLRSSDDRRRLMTMSPDLDSILHSNY